MKVRCHSSWLGAVYCSLALGFSCTPRVAAPTARVGARSGACIPGLWVRYEPRLDVPLDDVFGDEPDSLTVFFTDCEHYVVSRIAWESGRVGYEQRDYCADPIVRTGGVVETEDLRVQGFVLVPLGDVFILEGNGLIWPYVRCDSGLSAWGTALAADERLACQAMARALRFDPREFEQCGAE